MAWLVPPLPLAACAEDRPISYGSTELGGIAREIWERQLEVAMVPVAGGEGRMNHLSLLARVPGAAAFVESHARAQMERGVVVPEPDLDAVVGIVRANSAPFSTGSFAVAEARLGAEGGDPFGCHNPPTPADPVGYVATRLVVDTGMNLLGWTLAEGGRYMRGHIFDSETQIRNGSPRCSADPWGPALGDDFDLRRFHEAAPGPGSLPMTVPESRIGRFIEEELEGVA